MRRCVRVDVWCLGWFMELDDSIMSRWCMDTAKAVAEGSYRGDVLATIEAGRSQFESFSSLRPGSLRKSGA